MRTISCLVVMSLVSLAGVGGVQADTISNRLLYYAMDAGSGTSVANTGSVSGATCTLNDSTSWVAGHVGAGAVSFDGTDTSDRCVTGTVTLGLHGGTAYTVAAWVNITDLSQTQFLISKPWANGNNPALLLTATGKLYVMVANPTANATAEWQSTAALTTGWHHVAFVWACSTGTSTDGVLYVDGQPVAATFTPTNYSGAFTMEESSGPVYLGTSDALADTLAGSLDDVRLYARALSQQDITALVAFGTPRQRRAPLPLN